MGTLKEKIKKFKDIKYKLKMGFIKTKNDIITKKKEYYKELYICK